MKTTSAATSFPAGEALELLLGEFDETTGKAESEPCTEDSTAETADGDRDHVEELRVRHGERRIADVETENRAKEESDDDPEDRGCCGKQGRQTPDCKEGLR